MRHLHQIGFSLRQLRFVALSGAILALVVSGDMALMRASAATPGSGDAAQMFVIEDNDFNGPGTSNQFSIIPLLASPRVKVLGFTVVTGDGWENENSAHLRRFLEIIGRSDVPVADGAVYPLVNTRALMKQRQMQYGLVPWKGAWGGLGSIDAAPAMQPPVPALVEGAPHTPAIERSAAEFLIEQVHAHPHQVTIIAGGPLTNLALAIRLDPTFAQTAKQLVFMGGGVDMSMKSVTVSADLGSDFNMIFDPEAAHITLSAPWPMITSVANIGRDLAMSPDYVAQLAQIHTPLGQYVVKYHNAMPLWDELTSAIAIDPSLMTRYVDAFFYIDLSSGPNYGRAVIWPQSTAPHDMNVQRVRIMRSVDRTRFFASFLKDVQAGVARRDVPQ